MGVSRLAGSCVTTGATGGEQAVESADAPGAEPLAERKTPCTCALLGAAAPRLGWSGAMGHRLEGCPGGRRFFSHRAAAGGLARYLVAVTRGVEMASLVKRQRGSPATGERFRNTCIAIGLQEPQKANVHAPLECHFPVTRSAMLRSDQWVRRITLDRQSPVSRRHYSVQGRIVCGTSVRAACRQLHP